MKVFVLGILGTRIGPEPLEALRAIEKETYLVYGDYDVISRVEGTPDKVHETIRQMWLRGVADTNTLIVNEESELKYVSSECGNARKCAYVLMKSVRPTRFHEWIGPIGANKFVCEAHEIYGVYDAIVSIREEGRSNFLKEVITPLFELTREGLIGTKTLFTVEL
jgi:hypothetical protein